MLIENGEAHERATVERAPKQIARLEKRLVQFDSLVDKWKEGS